ncbi:DUF4440 domain-containing protein [Paludibacterium purpuratum]|uniref:Calcium/calmodulin-dependent protein kinase II association-domain domain-containing protein n=1 Tax=Paludibacterium purpuratum TaxID=1144873 RepID=A0A4V3DUK1_9NEIS|nr:DUF4440 domain-containing protein [Paludibacterium purpuratum]TDR73555.1 hypothetical protein DFP86_11362 [Paludibacterium purpuratum]
MKVLSFCLSLVLAGTNALAYADTNCKPTTQAEIAGLFDRWNASLQTGDPAKVAANYAQGSLLLPTLSNKPRLTQAEKIDYFEHFLVKKPVGQIDQRVVSIGCNSALDSGLYTFRFGDGSLAHARYTFTYDYDGKQWLITSHHSSLMPEKR